MNAALQCHSYGIALAQKLNSQGHRQTQRDRDPIRKPQDLVL